MNRELTCDDIATILLSSYLATQIEYGHEDKRPHIPRLSQCELTTYLPEIMTGWEKAHSILCQECADLLEQMWGDIQDEDDDVEFIVNCAYRYGNIDMVCHDLASGLLDEYVKEQEQ